MARILAIGIAALDVISVVDAYPAEDSEVRAAERRIARGGNAANTLGVLQQLGHQCSLGAVLSQASEGRGLVEALQREGINTVPWRVVATGQPPTSLVILNRHTGSRTIIHHRELPEFSYADFQKLDIGSYDWVHLEGRNINETRRMLLDIRQHRRPPRISVEIEKPREGEEVKLLALADVILFSRAYALHRGYDEPAEFLRCMAQHAPQADLVCSWGNRGARACTQGVRRQYAAPAYPPERVVDTVGAGDTFNAGMIDALVGEQDLGAALEAACRLAGRKCGQVDFEGLAAC